MFVYMGLNYPRDRSVFHSIKIEWKSHLTPFMLDIELLDLKVALLGFSLTLVQYFLTMPLLFPFGKVSYILCHSLLEICHFLFHFTGGYS